MHRIVLYTSYKIIHKGIKKKMCNFIFNVVHIHLFVLFFFKQWTQNSTCLFWWNQIVFERINYVKQLLLCWE